MDQHPKHSILEYPPGVLQSIRKLYDLDNTEVLNASINSLQNWVNKQDHFVKKDFERKHLEWALVTSKGSIERAKERLDKYCAARVLHQKMFVQMDLKICVSRLRESFNNVVLPKFGDNFYRVGVCKFLKIPSSYDAALELYKYAVIFSEYLRKHDFLNGIVLIVDYSDVNVLELIKVLNIANFRQFISVCVDCYGMRVKAIHAITSSHAFDIFLSILKQGLSAKLRERINIHKTYETLRDFISEDVLPVDYGGKEQSLKTLNDKWLKEIFSQEHTQYMNEMLEFRTDESRRQVLEFNNHDSGIPGSFKQILID